MTPGVRAAAWRLATFWVKGLATWALLAAMEVLRHDEPEGDEG